MNHQIAVRVGPVGFRIGSDWRAPIDLMQRLYAAYPQCHAVMPTATVRLQATRPWRRFIRPSVHIGGDFTVPDAQPLPLKQALLAAEMGMNLQVALGWRQHLLLHASSVACDDGSILMSGASGSGKSSLAALLGERQWRLMGDEFALLDIDGSRLWPFPRPISLKNESINAVTAGTNPARLGPTLTNTPKGTIRHLVPRADALAGMDTPAIPRMILFPTFGQTASLRPMGPAEAFMRLTDASTNYVALGEAGHRALVRLVQHAPAFAIGFSSGAEGIDMVEQMWAAR